MTCKCHPTSPFRWREHEGPSLFARDRSYKPRGDTGLSQSLAATTVVERERKAGRATGTLYGMGHSRDPRALRTFHQYAKASTDKVTFDGVDIDKVYEHAAT